MTKKSKHQKIVTIPQDVWKTQIACEGKEDVWAEFMATIYEPMEEQFFSTDKELCDAVKAFCEKHNITGVIYHEHADTK